MSTETAALPGERTVYAVWIKGKGWLKQNEENAETAFVSFEFQVAETAAHLWGSGAQVLPFDGSLLDLEARFLKREAEHSFGYRVRAWLRQHGILG